MRDTTKEAILNAKRAIVEVQRLALTEAVENPEIMPRVADHVSQLSYWSQHLENMLNGPRYDQMTANVAPAPQIAMAEAPRGPAW